MSNCLCLDMIINLDSDGSISLQSAKKAAHGQVPERPTHHSVAHKQAIVRTLLCRVEGLRHQSEPSRGEACD